MSPFGHTARAICAGLLLILTAMAGAQVQRVPNTTLAMPQFPPTFGYTSSNAFPGLSFTNPVNIVSPPGETNRLFIVGKNGFIYVITNLAAPTETIFMNISNRVTSTGANSGDAGEQGLLSLAFDPGYMTNNYFYVFYTGQATNGTGSSMLHHFLSRFKFLAGNTNQGDPNSETYFYVQYKRWQNHNGGDIMFGPDGYLYVSVGDEGMEYDYYTNAQHITWRLWSGILRLDVDKIDPLGLPPNTNSDLSQIFSKTTNYDIPHDNPFVGATTFDGEAINSNNVQTEFWAVGLRNPWRMSFDPATSNLFCGDVGQDKFEEADIITKGGNYGWSWWEGTNTPPSGVSSAVLAATPQPVNPINPFVTYAHGSATNLGNAIIGGVVYRGSNLSQLYGCYVFGDYVDGNIWAIPASQAVSLTQTNGTITPPVPIFTDNVGVSAFGVDPRNGDVLYTSMNNSIIKRIIYNSVTNGAPLPPTLYDTGAFTNLMSLTSPQDTLQTAPGILPYTINVPFWSDNAIKSRWFSVSNTNLTIGFNPSGNWSFPTGTVWIKHFNLELTNGDPTSEIRLETRLLVKNSSGIYGVTYRWGGSQTNATLVPAGGMDDTLVINNGGILQTQDWHYPSQQECQICHTTAGGFGLGFRTEQLNCGLDYGFGPTNEIQALSAAGYFSSPVTNDPNTLLALAAATNTSASLEFRSRSFLMANCSQCHQPGGTAQQANWDARITTPTALAGLIYGALVNNLGNISNCVIAPNSPANSVLLARISTRDLGKNPSIQMPPLDSNVVDTNDVNLITQWILSMTNAFWIGASPDPQTVAPGNNAIYTISFIATSDFTNGVTLSVSGLPAGAAAGFSPATVNSATTNSTLNVTTSGATPIGAYALIVTGTGGGVTNTDTMNLIVASNTAAPGTLVWTSGSGTDTNWSNALNWTNVTAGGYGPPGPANSVQFTNAATANSPVAANNFVNGNFVIAGLQYANNAANTSPNYHVTLINNGQTLVVTNGVVVGTAADSGASQVVNAAITGTNGTLILSNGVVAVTQGSGSDGAHQAVLDLSTLGTLNVTNVSRIAIAVYLVPPQAGNGGQRSSGVLYLAKTNVIAVTSTGVTNGILVGWNDSQGNGNTSGVPNTADKGSALYLGQTNTIFTDAIYVGTDKTLGCLLAFNPNGLNNPTAYFRGINGAAGRISLWGIGDTSMKTNSNQSASGTNDFTGGTINALVASMNVGVSETGTSSGNTGNGTGVLTFNAGTIDVNNLTNGWSVGTGTNGTDNGTGTVNVNGTATLKVNNLLALAQNTSTGAGVPSGTLNVNGGTVAANTIIAGSGVSTITLNNATLIVTNTAGTPASPIGTFSTTNSTLHLRLNGSAIGTNIFAANLNASGASTIAIDSVVNVTGVITFPILSYTGTAPASGNFVKGALPSGFSGNLVNNSAQKRIDLVIAPNASVTPRINALSFLGTNLIIGGTNGFPSGYYYVLTSTNLATPLHQWLPVSTNPFDLNGGFNFTNPMNPNSPQFFYLLQLQQ